MLCNVRSYIVQMYSTCYITLKVPVTEAGWPVRQPYAGFNFIPQVRDY
jgi:hypothetical protein